jgi:hypothetical protein
LDAFSKPSGASSATRIAIAFTILAGIVLRYRALLVGWMLDDYAQRAFLEGHPPLHRSSWDLYAFVKSGEARLLQETGGLPWWADPEMKLSFFRPLSSLLAAADASLFGRGPLGPHVHSLLWWVALLVAASVITRRVTPGRAAIFALLAYALEEAHTLPLAWIANRNTFVAAALSAASLVYALRARDHTPAGARAASLLLFSLALLAGEYALATLGYIAGVAWLDRSRTPRARVLWAAPWFIVALAYVVVHAALGYGVDRFPFYADPLSEPARFVPWSLTQMGSLLADLTLGAPAGLPAKPWTLAGAVLVTAALARFAPRSRPLLLGAVLSLAPLSVALAGPRMLVLPALGFAAAVGEALDFMITAARAPASGLAQRLAPAVLASTLATLHFGWAPHRVWRDLRGMGEANAARERAILAAPVDDATAARERWIVLAVAEPTTLLYFPTIRRLHGHPLPRGFYSMTMAPNAQLLTRVDERTITLRSPRSGLFGSAFALVMRPSERGLAVGDTMTVGGLELTVLERGPRGPNLLQLRADVPLDDPSLRFLIATPFGYERYTLPPVGVTIGIPPAADPTDTK